MPDKKLTDKDIVKALECHRHIGKETCDSCPLQGVSMCSFVLINEVYNRFNLLQAENERLKPFEDKIAEFNSHIRVEDMLVFANSLEEWLEFCDNLKSKAYKECIEKVKENSNKMELVCSGALVRTDYTITKEKLDNLLKELIGE